MWRRPISQEVTFGNWVRQRRTELGVTRNELSERVGFSLDLLRKLESGERRPSGQIAHLLADYFRIPADERQAFVTFARTGQAAAPDASNSNDRTEQGEGSLGRASLVSPWRRAYIHQTNIPAMLTPLIGRGRELLAVREQILNPKIRLLTLTGAPGIGKTSLGLRVALDLVDHFEDGVFFVDLAPITNPDLALVTIAQALGLKEEVNRSWERALLAFVGERRMLLLLDNFEQVLDAANSIVGVLVGSPWLKVLVTSREALHVRGERRFPVPPLRVPNPKQLPPVDVLVTFPAVELFVERAQAVAPDFGLAEGNSEDVAAVCVGLEGLPLAIELAASLAEHLTPAEMRAGLTNRFKLLTESARDLPTRQRTLYAAIEWSYDLLDEAERRLFRMLGVFVGGFTREAAEAVCSGAQDPSLPRLLASLVGKNLILGERREGYGVLRFSMLETILEYARDKLEESGEQESLKRRHAQYFLGLAEEVEPKLMGSEQVEWSNRLEEEHDNIRAALGWAFASGEVEVGLRLAGAMWSLWYLHGHYNEGRRWVQEGLARARGVPVPAYVLAKALNTDGVLAWMQGDLEQAKELFEESLRLFREVRDKWWIPEVLNNLGCMAVMQGDYLEARSHLEEALALKREIGEKGRIAMLLNNLANMEIYHGDYVAARPLLEESINLAREAMYNYALAAALNSLGIVSVYQQDYAAARRSFEESMALFWEQGHKAGLVITLEGFASIDAVQNRPEWAMRLFGAVATMREDIGVPRDSWEQLRHEYYLAAARNRLDQTTSEAAWHEGRAMSMEQAIEYALGDK